MTNVMEGSAEEEALCLCEWLTRDEIIAAIPLVKNQQELRERTGAGTVCFGCEGDLDDLVAEYGHLFGTGLEAG